LVAAGGVLAEIGVPDPDLIHEALLDDLIDEDLEIRELSIEFQQFGLADCQHFRVTGGLDTFFGDHFILKTIEDGAELILL